MLGSPCSQCCGCPQAPFEKASSREQGEWVPSGSWPNVTWTFQPKQEGVDGRTWYFYGGFFQSNPSADQEATWEQITDWHNLCNWYSYSSTAPGTAFDFGSAKRATELPPEDAIVHILSPLEWQSQGPVTVATLYAWGVRIGPNFLPGLNVDITCTEAAHGTSRCAVFANASYSHSAYNLSTINGGAMFVASVNDKIVNGGATFVGTASVRSENRAPGTVNGGADFVTLADNAGTVNGDATFAGDGVNSKVVNGNASFSGYARNNGGQAVVNGNATFSDFAMNRFAGGLGAGTVNGDAVFGGSSSNSGGVVTGSAEFNGTATNTGVVAITATFNDQASHAGGTLAAFAVFNGSAVNTGSIGAAGAEFNDASENRGPVLGNATFNDNSSHHFPGYVSGTPTFNDAACSTLATLKKDGPPSPTFGQRYRYYFTASNKSGDFFSEADTTVCNGSAPSGLPRGQQQPACGCG